MSTRVYVGGLSYRAREKDVERFFRRYGKIRDISMKNRYCFVDFDDYRDADDACYELNGKDLLGDKVTVEIAKGTPHGRDRDRWGSSSSRRDRSPRGGGGGRDRKSSWVDKYGPPTRTNFKITVENLSSRVSWQDLKDYMRQAGEVTYANAHQSHRNEGTVEFGTYEDMKAAIDKLDGTELNGKKIKLIEVKMRRSTSRSASRSRSRSKSKSRSRSKSPKRSKSRGSKSRSRSRSRKDKSRSRSRSRSEEDSSRKNGKSRDGDERNDKSDGEKEKD